MINYIGYFASAITGVFLLSFVGRAYGVSEVGYLGIWTSIYFILVQLGVFGLHNAITGLSQKGKKYNFPRSRLLLLTALPLVVINCVIIAIVGYVIVSFVPGNGGLLALFFITLVASTFPASINKVFFSFYSIGGSTDIVGWFSIVRSVGMIIYAIGVYLTSGSFKTFLFVFFFAECAGLLFYLLRFNTFSKIFDARLTGKIRRFRWVSKLLLKFSVPATFSNLVYEINTRVDILVCSMFVNEVALALYTIIVSLIEGFLGLAIISKTLLLPKLRDSLQGDLFQFVRLMGVRLTVAMAAFAFLVYFFGIFYITFTGVTITTSAIISFLILLTSVVAVSWTVPLHNLFFLFKRPAKFSQLVLLSTVINIVLNFVFVPRFGIQGAATATAISMLFLAVGVLWNLYRLEQINTTYSA